MWQAFMLKGIRRHLGLAYCGPYCGRSRQRCDMSSVFIVSRSTYPNI